MWTNGPDGVGPDCMIRSRRSLRDSKILTKKIECKITCWSTFQSIMLASEKLRKFLQIDYYSFCVCESKALHKISYFWIRHENKPFKSEAVVPTPVKRDHRVRREVRADRRHGLLGELDDFAAYFPHRGVQCLSRGHWYVVNDFDTR